MNLHLVCHFRGIFDAILIIGHNDTNSTDKDALINAQLLSLSIFKNLSSTSI